MGIFSSKKTIVVSSTVQNLAGDEANRPDFLKSSIFAAIMSPHAPWLGTTLVNNLFSGPGMGQRHFFTWCQRQSYPGLPTYFVTRETSVDPAVVGPEIPTPGSPAGVVLAVQTADLIMGSYEPIVEDFVLENYPNNFGTDYVSAYDEALNEITIQWFGGGSVTFSAGSYNKDKTYIVANYYHYVPAQVQSLTTGSTTTGVLTKPSTSGYSLSSSDNTGVVNYGMNYDERIIVTYTGAGAPPDTDDTTPESDNPGFDGLDEVWGKVLFEGGDGETMETINKEYFLHISEYRQIYTDNTQVSLVVNENTPSAGITQTIETRRIGDHIRPIYDWRIDTQDTINQKVVDGGSHMFIYEIGTGNATLDALLETVNVGELESEYFPYMPIRLDNTSITHAMYDDITGSGLYEKTNRAYYRAASRMARFAKLVDLVEENEDIDDIDYAFTHHGVAINVIEPACRRYMYTWLKGISAYQTTYPTYMAEYQAATAVYETEVETRNQWTYDQGDSGRPLYNTPQPSIAELLSLRTATVKLSCADAQLKNLDMRISWVNITETLHTGTPNNPETSLPAVKGDIWTESLPVFSWAVAFGMILGGGETVSTKSNSVDNMEMFWQTGDNSYKKLTIWGLVHNNYVYGGEAIETPSREGLAADVDEPTGFIIPLHYPTVRALGLVDATQMATANTFIVFNSYEIVKQKWYTTWWFMVIIIIVIIVITVLTGGLAAGGSVGILGSAASVGAAVGLTGTAAIIAGTIINTLVAIAVSQIISYASKELFGDKWGAIIAIVINLAITMGTSGGFDVTSLKELATASNIMAITSAVANGYAGYTQGAVAEIGDEMIENKEEFDEEMKKINKLMKELMGSNDLNFDQLTLTDSVKGNVRSASGVGYLTETLDEFIHRTTMTGSDIADITLSMVNNFADLSLELPSS